MGRPALSEGVRLQRHVRNLLIGLFLFAMAAVLDFARDFVLPVVLAFFLAITFRPAIRVLARRGVPEWAAATGFILIVVLGCSILLALMAGPISDALADAPSYAQIFGEKLRALKSSLQTFFHLADRIQEAAEPDLVTPAQEVVVREGAPFAYLGQVTGYSLSVMATIVLTLVLAAFLMASGDLFYAKLVRVLPTLTDKKTALRIVYDVEHEVSAYLLIVTGINAALGLAIGASFYVLGMPQPLLWGILAFVLNFIPYVGAVAGIGFAGFMAIVTFNSLGAALMVPLSYAIWNGIENQFVTPLFLGKRLQLNSVSIILALAFWTWIWGIPGTIVAVPLLVTIKVFCDHLESMRAVGEFLSERYPDEPQGGSEQAQPAAK